jgi:transcriptional regulator GlxA family with amidase domain
MRRRDFLTAGGLGMIAAGGAWFAKPGKRASAGAPAAGLVPPARGKIPVAFVVTEGATVIDFAGPWEVFQDVMVPDRGSDHEDQMPFDPYTVSDSTEPVTASAGLRIVPDHSFATAPPPRVVVVPAQGGRSPAMLDWLRATARTADVTMSVCTGAFVLARAGLLSGRAATTHHDFVDRLASQFPDVEVRRGLRFVESDRISTAGGLTSGIDLALRVVERYFGRAVARRTAEYMEYRGRGWETGGVSRES